MGRVHICIIQTLLVNFFGIVQKSVPTVVWCGQLDNSENDVFLYPKSSLLIKISLGDGIV